MSNRTCSVPLTGSRKGAFVGHLLDKSCYIEEYQLTDHAIWNSKNESDKTGETGMKKILGMTFGGLQKRAILLVALMLLLLAVMFAGITVYQNRMLLNVVA